MNADGANIHIRTGNDLQKLVHEKHMHNSQYFVCMMFIIDFFCSSTGSKFQVPAQKQQWYDCPTLLEIPAIAVDNTAARNGNNKRHVQMPV